MNEYDASVLLGSFEKYRLSETVKKKHGYVTYHRLVNHGVNHNGKFSVFSIKRTALVLLLFDTFIQGNFGKHILGLWRVCFHFLRWFLVYVRVVTVWR